MNVESEIQILKLSRQISKLRTIGTQNKIKQKWLNANVMAKGEKKNQAIKMAVVCEFHNLRTVLTKILPRIIWRVEKYKIVVKVLLFMHL